MNSRTSILDLFSTFADVEKDSFRRWATDGKLRRSIQRYATSQTERSEKLCSIYWFQQWQSQVSPLAELHLFAYLQEPAYRVSQQMVQRVQAGKYTLADYFQIANTNLHKVLAGFSADRGSSLKTYASLVLTNTLKDNLRQRQVVDICSDWALLRKWSKKRITEVLDRLGMTEAEIAQYQLAWFCFKTLYTPNDSAGEKSAPPNAAHWQEIANFYNAQRLNELVEPSANLTPNQIEAKMDKLARWLRDYLYPAVNSLNRPKPGEEMGEFQDDLSNDCGATLLDITIEQEELDQRSSQQLQMQNMLTNGLQNLLPELQEILQLFYQQQLSQQELASHLKLSQPTVSRRLKKAEESLLQSLLTWSEAQLNQFPDPNRLKSISITLREWLTEYYANL
jgi:RNA polymerase sigma factor (sigma-70 family)